MYLNTSLRLVDTLIVLLYMSWLNFPVDICSKKSFRSFGNLLNWLISSDVNAFVDEGSVITPGHALCGVGVDEGSVTGLALCGVGVDEGSETGLALCGVVVEFWGDLDAGDDKLVLFLPL